MTTETGDNGGRRRESEIQGFYIVADHVGSIDLSVLDPIALAIGHVTMRWAGLHEALGALFIELASPMNHAVGRSVWHAQKSDRNQREMLREVAKATLVADGVALREVKWLLNEVDLLSTDRNSVIHSAFTIRWNWGNPVAVPDRLLGNPKAARLDGKDIVQAATACAGKVGSLAVYATRVRQALSENLPPADWPSRPETPFGKSRKGVSQLASF